MLRVREGAKAEEKRAWRDSPARLARLACKFVPALLRAFRFSNCRCTLRVVSRRWAERLTWSWR